MAAWRTGETAGSVAGEDTLPGLRVPWHGLVVVRDDPTAVAALATQVCSQMQPQFNTLARILRSQAGARMTIRPPYE